MTRIHFCRKCGASMVQQIPPGDDRLRDVCSSCGFIDYQNPRLVVGTIPELEGKILLCKRNIAPQKGKWTLPAGYLENSETVHQGAARETLEETKAAVEIIAPYRLFNIPHISQLYLMFRSKLVSTDFGPTHESEEVRLFHKEEIPMDDIAFPVIRKTLTHYLKDRKTGSYPFRISDIPPSRQPIR